MKTKGWISTLFALAIGSAFCFGADDPAATTTTNTLSPWAGLIPLIVPVAVAAIKVVIPKIPKAMIPIICPILGALLEILGHFTGLSSGGTIVGVILGASGVFVREVFDQLKKAGTEAATGLVLLSLLGGATVMQSGCASVAAGNNAVIVNAERSHAIAVESINAFLKLEYDNRAFADAISPDIHTVANTLRTSFPPLALATWDTIQAFKTLRTTEAQAEMETKLAELQAEAAKATTTAAKINAAKK